MVSFMQCPDNTSSWLFVKSFPIRRMVGCCDSSRDPMTMLTWSQCWTESSFSGRTDGTLTRSNQLSKQGNYLTIHPSIFFFFIYMVAQKERNTINNFKKTRDRMKKLCALLCIKFSSQQDDTKIVNFDEGVLFLWPFFWGNVIFKICPSFSKVSALALY